MKLRAIQTATVDRYVKLVRRPVETAIGFLPDAGAGILAAARAGLERVDGAVRAVFGAGKPAPTPPPTHDDIAVRAYELYERGVPGAPDEHWQIAERELEEASRGAAVD